MPITALLLAAWLAAAPSVAEQGGDIVYTGADGATRAITHGGGYSDPVLSPDGHTIAFIHTDKAPDNIGFDGQASLWVADAADGSSRRLTVPSGKDEEPARNLNFVHHPIFSLDGGFVYVSAQAWVTSDAVHQISLRTGAERFVVDGSALSVIRTGPWRGYLLVGRHMYYHRPEGGSYNPVYAVRPDNKQSFLVPGSDKDDGEHSVDRWLRAHKWQAW